MSLLQVTLNGVRAACDIVDHRITACKGHPNADEKDTYWNPSKRPSSNPSSAGASPWKNSVLILAVIISASSAVDISIGLRC
ncbi:hypothetical protein Y1Q_0007085 [Alligator mississippiensis]|uniref:Uncharacterized protein n=1 Tax=Alligator mississippiensis TaxID=8496 RepID=A0A151N5N5_ALLMI|nr:hypothetical protein Y1Q_0007085 [Alligator mississippiensis]